MTIDNNRIFIETRLNEISTAVMYSQSNNLGKLTNAIVEFYKMDDCGHLWFTGHRPKHRVKTYEHNFPARLFFFRKGIDFFIETSGVARIAKKDELTDSSGIKPDSLLFKMTPSSIEYTETGKQQSVSTVQDFLFQFYKRVVNMLTIHSGFSKFTSQHKTKGYG
jgi:general stress protein 26